MRETDAVIEQPMSETVRDRRPPTPGPDAASAQACRRMRVRRVGADPATRDAAELPGVGTGRDAVRSWPVGGPGAVLPRAAAARAAETAPGRTAMGARRSVRGGDRPVATGVAAARPPCGPAPKRRAGAAPLGAALLFAAAWFAPLGAAAQAGGDPALGRELAERWCGGCHRVGPGATGPADIGSANDAVPGFAAIAAAPSTTAASLHAFLRHPHGAMPDLRLTEAQIRDIGAYILSLRGR